MPFKNIKHLAHNVYQFEKDKKQQVVKLINDRYLYRHELFAACTLLRKPHQFIINIISVQFLQDHLMIVMEFALPFTQQLDSDFLKQLVLALQHIHQWFVHCDIKFPNLLIQNNQLQLTDFGRIYPHGSTIDRSTSYIYNSVRMEKGEAPICHCDFESCVFLLIEQDNPDIDFTVDLRNAYLYPFKIGNIDKKIHNFCDLVLRQEVDYEQLLKSLN